jgi:ligand-binding SRPBCC domain-containing protein
METERTLTFRSRLDAPAADVWKLATTMGGVNYELMPRVRMTVPPEARDLSILDAPVAETLFRSWVLLFGAIPLDLHSLRLSEIGPGHRFVEESTSALQRRWRHERTVVEDGEGCIVTDQLTFSPRLRLALPVVAEVVRGVFEHRHARLRARWGGVPL